MRRRLLLSACFLVLALALEARPGHGQGIISPGAGPINLSMAGASTAAPIDFGSSYWNPATLSGLDSQEALIGTQLIIPSIHLQTRLPAGSVNGVFPPENRFGTSRSDGGVLSNLATGTSFRLSDDSPLTFGLGVFGVVGGGVNYAGSSTTPLLTPNQPPNFLGFGPIWANMSLLQLAPMVSAQMTDRLAIAGGPVISTGTVNFAPAFFAPGPKSPDGLSTFPTATNSRPFWGGGFQLGALLEVNENWNLGFSYKSPIWQERWSYNASTPAFAARRIGIQAQIPAIYSWGVAYKGIDRALIDVDLRYIDYANAALFGQSVPDGGLGWRSVFAVATGAQYKLSDRLTLRAGYLYNTNPVPSPATLFNVQAPGITMHTLSLGTSYTLTDNIVVSAAYVHGFRNAISGGVEQIPGASARFDTQTDSIVMGLNIKFGAARKPAASPVEVDSDPMLAPPLPAGSTGS
jgi:long-chain fatty acid transport protein